ncbi:hypothetical protein F2Q69_00057627 [Brassica cretica]|uniref:Uncharacterized protein n=1 Tax=Brassica cretica TaxID=69181 RepID=A0A8S9MMI8_BRACR|nr:hypothetical protein F2Q69_00057627 [Brassica cretica]
MTFTDNEGSTKPSLKQERQSLEKISRRIILGPEDYPEGDPKGQHAKRGWQSPGPAITGGVHSRRRSNSRDHHCCNL